MTSNHNTQTDAGVRAGVIKLGLDVHASSIVVVRQVDAQGPQPAQRFTPGAFLAFAKRQIGLAGAVYSCYEAGPFGYVLHRQLAGLGVQNLVVRPRDWSTYGERVKTDSRDAGALCSCLDRYLAGNQGALAVVRVPSEAEEAARALGRQRQALANERVRLTLQGKSAALLRGIPLPKDWWEPKVLPTLELPADLLAQLQIWQRVLVSIDAELQALTVRLQQAAPAGLPAGLGPMTWELLHREVGDWHRFRNRRQVASYTGLCPSEHSSGQSRLQGCINRHGNPRVRHLLIEAVWRLFKFQPRYRAIAKWLPVLSGLKISGARKKKIIVAIARQLAVDLWRIATGRTTAAALGLQST